MAKIDPIRQTEVAECGLACLVMVARFHGNDVNLAGLRARFGASSRGVTLRSLMKIADQLGLSSRAVRLDLDSLSQLRLPAVAHWELDHFVVIEDVGPDGATIADPALGARRYTFSELSRRFTGVALELTPSSGSGLIREKREPLRLRELAREVPGVWMAAGQVAALALILQAINLVPPLLIQNVIDKVLPGAEIGLLNVIALGFAAVVLLATLCDALSTWVTIQFGHSVGYSIVRRIFVHMLKLPLGWFEARGTGDILAKIQSHRPIQELFISTLPLLLSDIIVVIVAAIAMGFYSLTLSAVVFASLAAVAIISAIQYPRLRKHEEELISASVDEQGYVVETLRAIRVVRSFGGETERDAAWQNHFARVINAGVRGGKLRVQVRASVGLVNGLQSVVVVYLAARLIIRDPRFTAGMFFAFLFFRQSVADRANGVIQKITALRLARLHLERLSDILKAEPEREEGATAAHRDETLTGSISLSKVWMRYGQQDSPVVRSADLDIPAGQFVAIVGPTGGGKTSLLKLMAGLAEPYSGEILVDGRPLKGLGYGLWREHIGAVMQDDTLLAGTIADNISFFDPNLDIERVRRAATLAAVAADIDRMPMRYWTWVGDMGSALSGGQRQRLLLARALYRDPLVLFLDEGTANLDTDTEKAIVETVASLTMTRIVVSHRPALVARAHRVVTVFGGVVVEAEGEAESLAEGMRHSTLVRSPNRFLEVPC